MTVRWGIIGCGDIARKRVAHAIQIDTGSELLAACRRNEAELNKFCDAFRVPRAYTSAEQVLADEELDAVYIATPVKDHRSQTIAAAQAGKHVLCEKPMALHAGECDEMIAACRENNVQLGVAYYRRFYPSVLRMKELLAAGEIGTPLSVGVVCSTPFGMTPDDDGYWRVIPESGGGGSLMDIGSHRINLLLDMFGEVAGLKSLCGTVAADYESENLATVLFEFQSGMHGALSCVFGTPVDPDEFSILGTAGRLHIAPLNGKDLIVETAAGRRVEELPPHENLHAPLVADFTAAIADDRPPLVTGEEGRAVTAVMDWAYREAGAR